MSTSPRQKGTTNGLLVILIAAPVFAFTVTTAPVAELVDDTNALLGNTIGVFAGVAPNPYNTLAQELQEKENELAMREAALAGRETTTEKGKSLTDWLGIIGFILSAVVLVLVVLNFFFDWRRNKQEAGYAIDLKNR